MVSFDQWDVVTYTDVGRKKRLATINAGLRTADVVRTKGGLCGPLQASKR
jgi:hypothetical protein